MKVTHNGKMKLILENTAYVTTYTESGWGKFKTLCTNIVKQKLNKINKTEMWSSYIKDFLTWAESSHIDGKPGVPGYQTFGSQF